jgi:tetratricopeptide (TPR) repeat protein
MTAYLRWFRSLVALALFALVVASSPSAHAEDTKEIFQRAARAYREGRYEQAIQLFQEAHAKQPHPELVYNMGQAYEKLGNVPKALEHFRDYVKLAPGASDRATVEKRIQSLERRLSSVVVSVASTPSGAVVHVDGERVGQTPWTGRLAPGGHTLKVSLAGHVPVEKRFEATDRALDLDLTLTARQPAAERAVSAAPEERRGVSPLTFVVLGAGVAALGGAIGFELARRGQEDDARSSRTQLAHEKAYDRMQRDQTIARVLVGAGAAAIAAGGTLLYLDLSRADEKRVGLGLRTAF